MDSPLRLRLNKDPWSWITHFAGFLAAIAGTAYLVGWSLDEPAKLTAMALYGSSLIVLFLASTAYHFFDLGERGNRHLQRIDHIGIYVLIAGSYLPPVMHLLDGGFRIAMLVTVSVILVLGTIQKIVWMDAPEWLSTGIYLAFGWIGLIPAVAAWGEMTWWGACCLVTGGAAYTIGAIVFAREWPDPWPKVFGHHEIWHVLVLLGALGHFLFAATLLDVPVPAF